MSYWNSQTDHLRCLYLFFLLLIDKLILSDTIDLLRGELAIESRRDLARGIPHDRDLQGEHSLVNHESQVHRRLLDCTIE